MEDEKPTEVVLLFSSVNVDVRRDLIRKGFPTRENFPRVLEKLELGGVPVAVDSYDAFSDDGIDLQVFHMLVRRRVVRVEARGFGLLRCFKGVDDDSELDGIRTASRVGLISAIAGKLETPVQGVIDAVYTSFTRKSLSLEGAPGKCIFLTKGLPMTDSLAGVMEEYVLERMAGRLRAFERFIAAIRSDAPIEKAIAAELGIPGAKMPTRH